MEKLRRSSKNKTDVACKRHPKHQQSPGVCSLCLKEKLERVAHKLSTYSVPYLHRTFSASPSTTSSLSSYYSSSSASSSSSPAPGYDQKGSISWLLSGENNVLSKSRSLVNYFPRRKREMGSEEKKKSRFWTKLLRPISKRREEGLMHSRTVREIRVPNRVL
ncbi:hypothetical protein D8674_012903 [Pyrus ussuriensis x Pyrus communis]|uniref:Uncharacterized protein n=1 Tax=Pyrus ussuriensis x Pyrus communis TaxID=2448454 RepID=A0A5N5H1T7_9ROSA|nr:hypothetical protein D8674_012903 [Pyrus ussuriensis x Pyrus communis]